MQSSKTLFVLALLLQTSNGIMWFPRTPEFAYVFCGHTDICCEMRYPTFINRHLIYTDSLGKSRKRKNCPVQSTWVRFREKDTPNIYVTYKCQHTLKQPLQGPDPNQPAVISPQMVKVHSPQTFELRCGRDSTLTPFERTDPWRGGVSDIAVCVPNKHSEEVKVRPGTTECTNLRAPPTLGIEHRFAEIYELLDLEPGPDAELMLTVTEVGSPSTRKEGMQAFQVDVRPEKLYRACATSEPGSSGGRFQWGIATLNNK